MIEQSAICQILLKNLNNLSWCDKSNFWTVKVQVLLTFLGQDKMKIEILQKESMPTVRFSWNSFCLSLEVHFLQNIQIREYFLNTSACLKLCKFIFLENFWALLNVFLQFFGLTAKKLKYGNIKI